jgi:hypothetical protein
MSPSDLRSDATGAQSELLQPVSPKGLHIEISFLQRSGISTQTPIFAAPLRILTFERDPNLFRQISRL